MTRQTFQFAKYFFVRVIRSIFPDPLTKLRARQLRSAKPKSRWFGLEPLEHRLLLSADLVIDPPSLILDPFAPGTLEVGALVRNNGDTAVETSVEIDLYVRPEGSDGTNDVKIGTGEVTGALAPLGQATTSMTVSLPASLAIGSYSLVAVVDPENSVVETVESNNTSAPGASFTWTSQGLQVVTIQWVNPAGGDWNDPLNWEGGQLPTATDIVLIHANPGATITLNSGTAWVQAIETFNPLVINGGLLRVDDLLVTDQTITLNGGTIQGGTVRSLGGGGLTMPIFAFGTLDGVTLDTDTAVSDRAILTVRNGLTLANGHRLSLNSLGNSTQLIFAGASQSLAGSGEVVFGGLSSNNRMAAELDAGQTLTLGAGITVHSGTGGQGGTVEATSAILNQGTIAADANGMVVASTGNAFTNTGTLRAQGGGNLLLNGNYTTAQLGTLVNDGTGGTGVIRLDGTLNNNGATLTLTATTGALSLGNGTIQGGTVRSLGGGGLTMPIFAFGTLDGVTLDTDTAVSDRAILTVRNGLTLANGHRLSLNSLGNTTQFIFAGASQSLAGSGEVVFSGLSSNIRMAAELDAGQTLTLGAGITVHSGAGGQGGTVEAISAILNQGTIAADANGMVVALTGNTFTNTGTLRAQGGGILSLNGNYTTAQLGTLVNDGTGVIRVDGTLNNNGATLTLTATTGALSLGNGTIQGGTVRSLGGGGLTMPIFAFGTLDGVTLDTDTAVSDRAILTVRNGLTLANGHRLSLNSLGNTTQFIFAGASQSLAGSGEVVFSGLSSNIRMAAELDAGQTLTLGAGITVHSGAGGQGGTVEAISAILNQGTIAADANGMVVALTGNTFTNTGTLRAQGGGILLLNGNYTTAQLGTLVNDGTGGTGVIRLDGTLNNNGATLTLTATTGALSLGNGTIQGGTVRSLGGGGLTMPVFAFGKLDGVTLDADTTVSDRGILTVRNGLTLTNGHRLSLNSLGGTTQLLFAGASQSLAGSGEVVFGGLSSNNRMAAELDAGQTLTIGAGITVHSGAGGQGGTVEAISAILNQGTIAADVIGMAVVMTGSAFTSEGILESTGGNLIIDTSLRVDALGIISGTAGSILVTGNLLGDTRNADLFGTGAQLQFAGSGTLTAPQLLEVMGFDAGGVASAFSKNFSYGTLTLVNGTFVRLVDVSDNATGGGPEALYTRSLVVPAGTTLDLNGLHVYVRAALIGGTVVGGSITQVPDSGLINLRVPTPGAITLAGERDEWSFFARAGQLITVTVDTGSSAILAPALAWARVELVDSNGGVLAASESTAPGQVLSIDGAVIAADGNFRVVVTTPASHPSATGNYLVTVWDTTPNVFSLLLNQQVIGQIETPFSIDQWQFSAAAGTQVRFDLINREHNGITFDLSGPGGYSAFTSLGADSDLVLLPHAGRYTLTAHPSGGAGGGAYAFRVQQTQITDLALGATYNGQFAGSGYAQLFRIDVPTSNPLEVVLDDNASNNANELYLKFGAPPTRSDYDYRFDASAASDQQVLAPLAYAGQWYALIYGDTIHTNSNFSFTARSTGVLLDAVAPDRYATGAVATIHVQGGGFDSTTLVVLVAANSSLVLPISSTVISPSAMTATFSLSGVAPGAYSVRASEPGGTPSQLTDAFTVTEPGEARLVTNLVLPGLLGRHSTSTLYIEYTNAGNQAMPAPLLVLASDDPDNSDRPLLTLDQSIVNEGFWTSAIPAGFANSVQFLASGMTPGVLQPGESGRIPVYYVGLQLPYDFDDNQVEFVVGVLDVNNSIVVDWNTLKDGARPDYVRLDAWEAIWGNFASQVGGTWGSYLAALDENAVYLGALGVSTADIARLLGFELRQADGLSPIRYLATGLDAALPAPGLDLVLSRGFAEPISRRYELGPLGRGWANNWQLSLATEPDGTVKITDMTGTPRIFQPDSRFVGTYFAATGDHGKLSSVGGGAYRLTETDGTACTFRADGRLDFVQDSNNNRITCSYTAGVLTALTHSSGQSLTIVYNAAGRISSVTDSDGRQTLYTFDVANEHLLSVRSFDGRVTAYQYVSGQGLTREHAIAQVTFSDGSHRFYTYDPQGRLASTSRDGGAESLAFSYDATGTVTVTDVFGHASILNFDDGGAVLKATNPLGNSTLLSLDEQRNLRSVTDPAGHTSLFQYDARGNVTRSIDAVGHVSNFTYTTNFNRLDALTDANDNLTDYRYDSRGNLTGITYADGSQEGWNYDSLGQSTTWTNRRNTPVGFTYDADGQITRKTYADGTHVDYLYDARGNLTSATDVTGTTTLSYDTNDRLIRIDYPGPGGRSLEYTYDTAGRRATSTDQLGHQLRYHYDALGRLSRITDEATAQVVLFEYDLAGRMARKTLGNGVFTTYEYDAAGQLLHLVNNKADSTVLSRFDYTYDNRGRRISMGTLDGSWTYEYDDIGQLTHAVFDSTNSAIPDQDLLYVYDAMGNRIRTVENGVTTEYTTNSLNQYTQVGNTTYTFDADGNLISETSSSGTVLYSYDDENRLIAMQQGADAWAYTYDAFGQRVETNFNGIATRYMIDPVGFGNVVGEYDAAGSLVANYDYGFGLLSRSTGGASSWYTFDAIGSTSSLTNAAQSLLNSYAYAPFGDVLNQTGSAPNTFQFVGEWGVSEESNGLDFMRARFASPTLGRFITVDPIGIAGGVNLYRYVHNSPLSASDPLGLYVIDKERLPRSWSEGARNTRFEQPNRRVPSRGPSDKGASLLGGLSGHLIEGLIGVVLEEWVVGDAAIVLTPYGPDRALFDAELIAIASGVPGAVMPEWHQQSPPSPPTNGLGAGTSGTAGASDPNQKLGPSGFSTPGFIASEITLPYRVDFENEPAATAPAQYVTVTDQLDADLDWNSFALTEIGFGDTLIAVPAGTQHFETTVPMHYNGRDFEVQIMAGINLATGQVIAQFFSIDPATGLPPDVLTGFLPPEDGTGRGMGYFSYSIKQKPGLLTGTQIKNIALISFDGQPWIATNQVDPHDPSQGTDSAKEALNTIDAGTPSSAVQPLPAETALTAFLVSWSGVDDIGGSGIANFDVYVSADGVSTLFQDRTTATSATFSGLAGHSYAFYSVARDNVGHVEAAPAVPDAVTRIASAGHAPVANDDTASTAEDTAVVINVLGNDTDANGHALSASVVTGPTHGGLAQNANGTFTYTPASNYFGPDSFTYFASDGQASSNVANVTLTVTPVNDAPVIAAIAAKIVNEGSLLSFLVSANDTESGALTYSLDSAPAGVAINPVTGLLSWTPADGAASAQITVRATDPGGLFDTEIANVSVQNVAPTLVISGAGTAVQGQVYTLGLSATDPGVDTVTGWIINWGDGTVQNVAGNPSTVTHTYIAPGGINISASASDEDGAYSANTLSVSVAVATPPKVTSFAPTSTGFRVTFNQAIDASVLNLYDTRTAGLGAADVTVTDSKGRAVSGSIVVNADGKGLTFIGTGGVLAPETYTVRLVSGARAFKSTSGLLLDGNGDGTAGDAFITTFTVATSGPTLSLPDFMRGPGQAVDITAPSSDGFLPLYISKAGGAKSVEFTLTYDPAKLTIEALLAGPDLPGTATVERLAAPDGTLKVRITSSKGLGNGKLQLLNIKASVPVTAAYGATQILDLSDVLINGAAGVGDDALHVVGYFGDTSGNAAYSTLDVQQLEDVVLKLDSGFASQPNVDPVIIGDISGSGALDSVDPVRLRQEVMFLTGLSNSNRLEVPPIPPGIGPLTFAGPTAVFKMLGDL